MRRWTCKPFVLLQFLTAEVASNLLVCGVLLQGDLITDAQEQKQPLPSILTVSQADGGRIKAIAPLHQMMHEGCLINFSSLTPEDLDQVWIGAKCKPCHRPVAQGKIFFDAGAHEHALVVVKATEHEPNHQSHSAPLKFT